MRLRGWRFLAESRHPRVTIRGARSAENRHRRRAVVGVQHHPALASPDPTRAQVAWSDPASRDVDVGSETALQPGIDGGPPITTYARRDGDRGDPAAPRSRRARRRCSRAVQTEFASAVVERCRIVVALALGKRRLPGEVERPAPPEPFAKRQRAVSRGCLRMRSRLCRSDPAHELPIALRHLHRDES